MQRDQPFAADDRFMWAIDTFLDGRTGYFFEINPSGAMGDGLITSPTGDGSFGGDMQQVVGRHLDRARAPHAASAGPPRSRSRSARSTSIRTPTRWGINFQRTVRRKNEESLWTGWPRNQGLHAMSNAGRLTRHRATSLRGSAST